MDNTVRKLNIGNTDYNFPQGFPIIAGYSSYGSRKIDLTQSFSLPFTTQYFGFSDTFPRNTSTITATEAITEIKKHRPLIFKWDWYDTESSGDEHFITAELYPVDGNLYQFRAIVPITVYRGVTTTYISRIDMSLVSHTFSYTYITTIPGGLNDLSNVTITTPTDGQGIVYDATTQKWKNGAVSGGHAYSTTEQVVGTWIDGSPVYEKSFSVTSPAENVPTNIIEITSLSVDDVVSLEGVINATSNAIYIGNTDWRMWTRMNWESTNKDYIACNITNAAYASQPLVVTIRYTKSST